MPFGNNSKPINEKQLYKAIEKAIAQGADITLQGLLAIETKTNTPDTALLNSALGIENARITTPESQHRVIQWLYQAANRDATKTSDELKCFTILLNYFAPKFNVVDTIGITKKGTTEKKALLAALAHDGLNKALQKLFTHKEVAMTLAHLCDNNVRGRTPLHWATVNEHSATIRLLCWKIAELMTQKSELTTEPNPFNQPSAENFNAAFTYVVYGKRESIEPLLMLTHPQLFIAAKQVSQQLPADTDALKNIHEQLTTLESKAAQPQLSPDVALCSTTITALLDGIKPQEKISDQTMQALKNEIGYLIVASAWQSEAVKQAHMTWQKKRVESIHDAIQAGTVVQTSEKESKETIQQITVITEDTFASSPYLTEPLSDDSATEEHTVLEKAFSNELTATLSQCKISTQTINPEEITAIVTKHDFFDINRGNQYIAVEEQTENNADEKSEAEEAKATPQNFDHHNLLSIAIEVGTPVEWLTWLMTNGTLPNIPITYFRKEIENSNEKYTLFFEGLTPATRLISKPSDGSPIDDSKKATQLKTLFETLEHSYPHMFTEVIKLFSYPTVKQGRKQHDNYLEDIPKALLDLALFAVEANLPKTVGVLIDYGVLHLDRVYQHANKYSSAITKAAKLGYVDVLLKLLAPSESYPEGLDVGAHFRAIDQLTHHQQASRTATPTIDEIFTDIVSTIRKESSLHTYNPELGLDRILCFYALLSSGAAITEKIKSQTLDLIASELNETLGDYDNKLLSMLLFVLVLKGHVPENIKATLINKLKKHRRDLAEPRLAAMLTTPDLIQLLVHTNSDAREIIGDCMPEFIQFFGIHHLTDRAQQQVADYVTPDGRRKQQDSTKTRYHSTGCREDNLFWGNLYQLLGVESSAEITDLFILRTKVTTFYAKLFEDNKTADGKPDAAAIKKIINREITPGIRLLDTVTLWGWYDIAKQLIASGATYHPCYIKLFAHSNAAKKLFLSPRINTPLPNTSEKLAGAVSYAVLNSALCDTSNIAYKVLWHQRGLAKPRFDGLRKLFLDALIHKVMTRQEDLNEFKNKSDVHQAIADKNVNNLIRALNTKDLNDNFHKDSTLTSYLVKLITVARKAKESTNDLYTMLHALLVHGFDIHAADATLIGQQSTDAEKRGLFTVNNHLSPQLTNYNQQYKTFLLATLADASSPGGIIARTARPTLSALRIFIDTSTAPNKGTRELVRKSVMKEDYQTDNTLAQQIISNSEPSQVDPNTSLIDIHDSKVMPLALACNLCHWTWVAKLLFLGANIDNDSSAIIDKFSKNVSQALSTLDIATMSTTASLAALLPQTKLGQLLPKNHKDNLSLIRQKFSEATDTQALFTELSQNSSRNLFAAIFTSNSDSFTTKLSSEIAATDTEVLNQNSIFAGAFINLLDFAIALQRWELAEILCQRGVTLYADTKAVVQANRSAIQSTIENNSNLLLLTASPKERPIINQEQLREYQAYVQEDSSAPQHTRKFLTPTTNGDSTEDIALGDAIQEEEKVSTNSMT